MMEGSRGWGPGRVWGLPLGLQRFPKRQSMDSGLGSLCLSLTKIGSIAKGFEIYGSGL